ncbi:hypothetical protein Rrhod_1737 [Rhodococcus rhodnii LMG 5362]|uniref:Alkyl sulfatase C-terminal domain-containing protein n=1 Tax=Rhodococcus rhodnii LMG 5362 TaxID=1273125 RepID=R7WSB5_9NOCA|nr:hypothetical protein Rrhod_1737 [Rhodococcus rhodnii LMG 5362]
MIIDSLAVQVDGPKAAESDFTMDWNVTDDDSRVRLTLSNGALTHRTDRPEAPITGTSDATLTLSKRQLLGALSGQGLGDITVAGDEDVFGRLLALLVTPDPRFAIVTP